MISNFSVTEPTFSPKDAVTPLRERSVDRALRYYQEKRYSEAFTLLKRLADQNKLDDPRAQAVLGDIYNHGHGNVQEDASEALSWYQKAHAGGLAAATFALGVLHQNGRGVEKSLSIAINYYKEAADKGCVEALLMLSVIDETLNQDLLSAAEWIKKAAENRTNPELLRQFYLKGHGIKSTPVLALRVLDEVIRWGTFQEKELAATQIQCAYAVLKKKQATPFQTNYRSETGAPLTFGSLLGEEDQGLFYLGHANSSYPHQRFLGSAIPDMNQANPRLEGFSERELVRIIRRCIELKRVDVLTLLLRMQNFEHLECSVKADDLEILSIALQNNTRVKSVALNLADPQSIDTLYKNMQTHSMLAQSLTSLSFVCPLTHSVDALCALLKNAMALTSLKLYGNKIDAAGFEKIGIVLKDNIALTSIDLGDNRGAVQGIVKLFCTLLQNGTLKSINLSWNKFSSEDITALSTALRSNSTLISLNVGCNDMGDERFALLCNALHHHPTLTSLNLRRNDITDRSNGVLCELLKNTPALTLLTLSMNPLTLEGPSALFNTLDVGATTSKYVLYPSKELNLSELRQPLFDRYRQLQEDVKQHVQQANAVVVLEDLNLKECPASPIPNELIQYGEEGYMSATSLDSDEIFVRTAPKKMIIM